MSFANQNRDIVTPLRIISQHTLPVQSFWSMLKRGIYVIYHHVSRKHLDKYVDEFEFRCNSKYVAESKRFGLMLNVCDGRMTYASLINRDQP